MKTIKVVGFMHAVIAEKRNPVVIKATKVNMFCVKMQEMQVNCVLDMHEFRGIAALYPQEVRVTPTELIVKPTSRLKNALTEANKFAMNQVENKKINEVWKSIK